MSEKRFIAYYRFLGPWFPPFAKDAKDGASTVEMAHAKIAPRFGHIIL
jgi:hypothetical protein